MKEVIKQWTVLEKNLGFASMSNTDWMLYSLLMLTAAVAGFVTYNVYRHWLAKQQFESHYLDSFYCSVQRFVYPLILITTSSAYFFIMFHNSEKNNDIVSIHLDILLISILIFLLRVLFYPTNDKPALITVNSISKKLYLRSAKLLIITVLLHTFNNIVEQLALSKFTYHVCISISVTIFILFFVYWLFLFTKLGLLKARWKALPKILNSIIYIAAANLVIASWLGYHLAPIRFATNTAYTILAFFGLTLLFKGIEHSVNLLNGRQKPWQQKFRYILGLKPHHFLSEIVIIKFLLQSTLIITLFLIWSSIWGVSNDTINVIVKGLTEGFTITGIRVFPLRLAIALLSFATISIIGRIISASITHNNSFAGELDTQNAMASITGYIMFAIAVLAAMLVSGINFTSVAIIAGALSVGVGLGLQNIVNNFVCGLILLIERPIKPGDRIIIGETEGIVQKVRIRSTQIKTRDRDDVIVPNSEFITQPIVNYMFRDRLWRVRCHIGVAYSSDVDHVKKLLFQIAEANDEVVNVAPNKPTVLFKEFAESTLMFEMRCVITDANRKNFVLSDLNTEIWRVFKEHGIEISFPQRDLHIRSWPGSEPPGDRQIITPTSTNNNDKLG